LTGRRALLPYLLGAVVLAISVSHVAGLDQWGS
jgi:hypothetical protein